MVPNFQNMKGNLPVKNKQNPPENQQWENLHQQKT